MFPHSFVTETITDFHWHFSWENGGLRGCYLGFSATGASPLFLGSTLHCLPGEGWEGRGIMSRKRKAEHRAQIKSLRLLGASSHPKSSCQPGTPHPSLASAIMVSPLVSCRGVEVGAGREGRSPEGKPVLMRVGPWKRQPRFCGPHCPRLTD